MKHLICWLIVFYGSTLLAQNSLFNANRVKRLAPLSDTVQIDTLSIVPASLSYTVFPQKSVEVVYEKSFLLFKDGRPDSIVISYKVFPFNASKPVFHRSKSDLYPDRTRPANQFAIQYNKNSSSNLLLNDGLVKNGNISRGISFGNNQDVVVNSNLNLQVSGKLSPEIDILLAATDNNIPFQADGTTAQLQEFDKVYIQLNNPGNKLIVGDYQLSKPRTGYFMNFYKRSQGMYFENNFIDSSSRVPLKFKTQISGAVSRGKFSRQVFFGIESNQGPYRLKGAENELFIIVLSGTEKIYIDGRLLQRGQENDYVIDYNTGEVTFTAKQLITKDKRIVAEFQYAERNYGRSLFFASEEVQVNNTNFFMNYFSEQDNPARPLQQTLSQSQKDILTNIGDTLSKALSSGAERVEFTSGEVLYRVADTIINDLVYKSIYVFSTDPDTARYRLKFSYVGENGGNYVQIPSTANGKVYKWMAPINGVPQGNYEPVIPLVTPKQQQMLAAGFSHTFTPNNTIKVEGVYTKNDINRFSGRDKKNDEGSGIKVISTNTILINGSSASKGVYLNADYEFVQKQFKQVERFRSVEFDRDWNRQLAGVINNDQQLYTVEGGYFSKQLKLATNVASFSEGLTYKGIRQGATANFTSKKVDLNYTGSLLNSENKLINEATVFYRHKANTALKGKKAKLTFYDELERNLFQNSNRDSLKNRAYLFNEWEAAIQNTDSGKTNIKLFYKERSDKLAYKNELRDSTKAKNIGLTAGIYSIKNNPVTVMLTYRQLDIINQVGTSLKPDNTLLNRVEYSPRWFKNFFTATVFYETGYGLENKKEFYYLEVAPGQGQYSWQDYNDNGLKELNEFEVAVFADQARFIRVYTPTNLYTKVLQNQFSFSFNMRPAVLLKNKTGLLPKTLARFNVQSAIKLDNKTNSTDKYSALNPFVVLADSALISSNNNTRHSLFFNQTSPVFGADYTRIDNKNRQLLLNGLETRALKSNEIKVRLNFLKNWSINVSAIGSEKENASLFLTTRNYLIFSKELENKVIFQPTTSFRIAGSYRYSDKSNRLIPSGEKAYLNNYGIEFRFSQANKGSLTGKMEFIDIKFNGDANSAVAYEMLNGLKNGRNYTIELSYQRNLGSNIQVSINYNGRKTGDTKFIHLGGAQVRAYF